MISKSVIQELAVKKQTTQLNIRREYVQHLFLYYFYRQPPAGNIFFKGGTALRIIFDSPRFSEDLDFSASIYKIRKIEEAIINTLKEIEREGIVVDIIESKETSGGYLSELSFRLGKESVQILLQFSKRRPQDKGEVVTISNDFIPSFTLVMLARNQLIKEKVQALLTRGKPRDFYDLYFLIRSNLIQKDEKKMLNKAKEKLAATKINFNQELKQFLPKSHWPIIRDFCHSLEQEIERFV